MPNKHKPTSPFPQGVAAPAQRALTTLGVTKLDQVTRFTETELLALHGMGSTAIKAMKDALKKQGKLLAKEK